MIFFNMQMGEGQGERHERVSCKSPHRPFFQLKYAKGDKKPSADVLCSVGAKSYL